MKGEEEINLKLLDLLQGTLDVTPMQSLFYLDICTLIASFDTKKLISVEFT